MRLAISTTPLHLYPPCSSAFEKPLVNEYAKWIQQKELCLPAWCSCLGDQPFKGGNLSNHELSDVARRPWNTIGRASSGTLADCSGDASTVLHIHGRLPTNMIIRALRHLCVIVVQKEEREINRFAVYDPSLAIPSCTSCVLQLMLLTHCVDEWRQQMS